MTRAWVEVDLGALRRNGGAIASRAGVPLLCMVKGDAYGIGAVAAARALSTLSPWGFGVATVGEGVALRDAGIDFPVVVFTPLLRPDLVVARNARLTPSLGSASEIAQWASIGGGSWHLQIDTGLSRAGVRWDAMGEVATAAAALPPEGAFTHFHSAERDGGSVAQQERRFDEAVRALAQRPALLHTENSAAIVRHGESRHSLVRPGVFLYGVGAMDAAIVPTPVVHLRARIVDIRTCYDGETVSYDATFRIRGTRRVATAALGYADGYPRSMSNCANALIAGRRAPVVGIVTMDMTMLDVTDVPCEVGDVATFLGEDGEAAIAIDDAAAASGVSAYELLTRLHGRLERVYRGGPS